MTTRILITGATGMIGTALRERLLAADYEVHTLVRGIARTTTEHNWDPAHGRVPADAIEWADAVVSLSGASLSRLPWTRGYRHTILQSRIDATSALARAINAATTPPRVWVSASAVGFYGRGPTSLPFDETSPKGTGFLADVVGAWEAAAQPAAESTRLVFARSGIVLGPAGALKPLALVARFGLGTTFGSGRQHWPWVSLGDEVRAIQHALETPTISGPLNIAAPVQNTAADVSRAVAAQLHRPSWLRIPPAVAHAALGTAADEMLLADQPVAPRVLTDSSFAFDDRRLADAVAAALTRD